MTESINKIRLELSTFYNKNEVESFISLILYHLFDIDRVTRLITPDIKFSKNQKELIDNIIDRLKLYEPIQYIIGKTEFCGLQIKCSPGALIPRPETEELVQYIIDSIKVHKSNNILDIGTGSGCIAISLGKNFPEAKIYAMDISADALNLARENARMNNINITFFQNNILNPTTVNEVFDVIVSNPPYVRLSEKADIKNNVLKYEPHQALFVEDSDPLIFYRRIAEFAQSHLTEGGLLFFEINRAFGGEIVDMLKILEFKDIILKKDIFGNDRFIKCKK